MIRALAANPRPPGCRKLQGSGHDDYRIRVGDYRVLYEVDDTARLVRIMRVRHRREVYRRDTCGTSETGRLLDDLQRNHPIFGILLGPMSHR